MRLCRSRPFVVGLFALLVPLAAASPARADLVLGFPQGLTDWSTAGDPGTVTANAGLATIAESTFETDLYLSFTMPAGAQSLQFTLNSIFADSTVADNQANFYTPDSFGASLVDPNTSLPLVPPDDPTTDSFYTRDIVDGVTQGSGASGVTVTPLAGTLGVISADLSGAGLDGQTVEVLFRLFGGTDPDTASTVTISDVKIITGAAVPEPASIIPGLTAVAIVGGALGARSRRRSAVRRHRVAS